MGLDSAGRFSVNDNRSDMATHGIRGRRVEDKRRVPRAGPSM